MHIQSIDTYSQPSKVEAETPQPEPRQATKYRPDAEQQEWLHSKLTPMFHLEESEFSQQSDSCYQGLLANQPRASMNTAHLPNQSFFNVALGSQYPSADFVAKTVHGPVGSTPTASAMLANSSMLGASSSWNPQHWQQYHHQQIQQHQLLLYHQQQLQRLQQLLQFQQLLDHQQRRQISHALSNPPPGLQSVSSPLTPCSLPAFSVMAAAVGRL
jgi:hypothetical protein